MRLTIVLLTTAFLQINAKGIAQERITLHLKNVSLEKVFSEISRQTGYSFLYEDALLRKSKPINIKVIDASLTEVLELTFKGQPLKYTIAAKSIVIQRKDESDTNLNVDEANIHVEGRVINEYGDPIASASVVVRSTNIGTTTNENGYFELKNIPENGVLIISAINIETMEVRVAGKNNLGNITVKIKIDESEAVVVNTGYQKVKPNEATGSFDRVGSELYNRQVTTDVISRLENISSSVYFSKTRGNSEIAIRGISTISTNSDVRSPLIILDNFPYEGSINNLNPNDIESVTILKDASAASIWGARAGNGVIVLTSKKAKYNQPLKISMNHNITFQKKPDLFYDQQFLNSSDFIDVEQFLFANDFYDNQTLYPAYYPLSPVVEILYKEKNGEMSASEANEQISAMRSLDVRNDFLKYLQRNSVKQQYSLSFSGGSNTLNYLLNLGYDKNISNTIGNQDERITVYSQTIFRPIKNLEIQTSLNYMYTMSRNNGISEIRVGGGNSLGIYPYARLADEHGNPLDIVQNYRSGYVDTAGGGLLLNWKYRPLEDRNYNDYGGRSQNLLFKAALKYHVTKSLNIEASGQLQNDHSDNHSYNNSNTYYTRDLINRYTNISGNSVTHNIPLGGILDNFYSRLSAYGLRGQLNYSKIWKEHQFSLLAGTEIRQNRSRTQTVRTYGYDDNLLTFSNIDYQNIYQLFDNLGSQSIPNLASFGDVLNRFVSFYGNMSYTYQNRYTLSASARKDASNVLGISTNNKWKPLWSTGLAWKISDEPFFNSSWMTFLRGRITYGFSGNIDNSMTALSIIEYRPAPSTNNLPFAIVGSYPNPELRWEKVGMVNAAIDFEIKNGILSGSFEYYSKKAIDLLSREPVDPTIGTTSMIRNVGNLTGKGVDVKLNIKLIDRANIRWNTQLLFSYVSNKVTKYLNESSSKGSYAGFGYSITPAEGKDPYALISYKWGGLDEAGNPISYLNGSKSTNYTAIRRTPTWDDLVIHGTTRPPYWGSLLTTFSWKKFSFSTNISYKFGFHFRRNGLNYSGLFNSWTGHTEFAERWKTPGDELRTNVPSMIYPANSNRDWIYAYSEATVERGDVIKIQDINISYNSGPLRAGNYTIQNIQIYSYVTNIGMIWRANDKGIDPDFGTGIPPALSFSFGIRADL